MSPSVNTSTRPGAVPAGTTCTYAEAAELVGVSADTIERDRKAGKYPNVF